MRLALALAAVLAAVPVAEARRGTHFVVEAGAGAAFGTGFPENGGGYALRTTVGWGGKIKGFPPRFYLIASARFAQLDARVERGSMVSEIGREVLDASAGIRVLLPIRRLRILGEVTLGGATLTSTARLNGGLERFETDDSSFAVYLAAGLQYRLHRNLSIGVLAEWSLPTDRREFDFVAEVSRLTDTGQMHGWTALTGTVVAHF